MLAGDVAARDHEFAGAVVRDGRRNAEPQARAWFDALWEEADPVDLAQIFEDIFAQYTPWEIFLRILFQLYGSEVAELEKEDKGLPLTSFQTHGVARALRLLRDRSGVIIADEVGLGKTFIAGEIVPTLSKQSSTCLAHLPRAVARYDVE
jgi:hypothetical protein